MERVLTLRDRVKILLHLAPMIHTLEMCIKEQSLNVTVCVRDIEPDKSDFGGQVFLCSVDEYGDVEQFHLCFPPELTPFIQRYHEPEWAYVDVPISPYNVDGDEELVRILEICEHSVESAIGGSHDEGQHWVQYAISDYQNAPLVA